MTGGDRRRNARRERLGAVLPRDGAVIGIDLADEKQTLARTVQGMARTRSGMMAKAMFAILPSGSRGGLTIK
jgi:hypothetical protein